LLLPTFAHPRLPPRAGDKPSRRISFVFCAKKCFPFNDLRLRKLLAANAAPVETPRSAMRAARPHVRGPAVPLDSTFEAR